MSLSNNETDYLTARWEKDTRYYQAVLHKDLFGWVVVKRWGGIGRSSGQQRVLPCEDYASALVEYEKIKKRRLTRGYVLVNRC